MKKTTQHIIVFAVIVYVVFPDVAFAYLDPGTGSYLLQIMVASLFGGAFLVKTWWKEIKSFLNRVVSRKDNKTSEKSPKEK